MKKRVTPPLFNSDHGIKQIIFLERLHIFQPFLIALESVIFIYLVAAVTISPDQTIRTVLIFWLILGLLFLPLYFIFQKNLKNSILILSIITLGGFSTQVFFNISIVIILLTIAVGVVLTIIRKQRIDLRLIRYLFSLANLFIVLLLIILFTKQSPLIPFRTLLRISTNPIPESLKITKPANPPDIYYFVMDGYGRTDMLDSIYQFDNSEFTSYLQSNGFIIPTQNHSNYPKTAVSMATTLNMDYIENLAPGLNKSHYWWLMTPLIDNSRVSKILERIGYQTFTIATDWDITNNPSNSLNPPSSIVINNFEWEVLSTVPIGFVTPFLERFAFVPSNNSHIQLVRSGFKALEEAPSINGPKFLVAHILVPHPPFLFDSTGNIVEPDYPFTFNDGSDNTLSDQEYRLKYIEQLKYTNKQLELVINSILQNSKTKPIIILQADHGPRMFDDMGSLDDICLQEKFSSFAAYYLPGINPDIIPQDISNVNIFRIVLDSYFGASLPQLENRAYYFNNPIKIYDLIEVTSRIEKPCTIPAPK